MAKSASAISVVFNTKGGPKRIVEKINDEDIRRAIGEDLAHMVLDEVNKYVPESSGKLKRAGYRLHSEDRGTQTMSMISYNNTRKVPYVLYQYYGIVYGPNYATWSATQYNPNDLRMRVGAVHTGWVSSKGKGSKKPTKNKIGIERTIPLKDGREIHITGYTKNKNAHHKWLEYVRTTPTIWYPLRQHMIKFVETCYSEYMGYTGELHGEKYNKYVRAWHKRRGY